MPSFVLSSFVVRKRTIEYEGDDLQDVLAQHGAEFLSLDADSYTPVGLTVTDDNGTVVHDTRHRSLSALMAEEEQ